MNNARILGAALYRRAENLTLGGEHLARLFGTLVGLAVVGFLARHVLPLSDALRLSRSTHAAAIRYDVPQTNSRHDFYGRRRFKTACPSYQDRA
jgi:hypothetical protein